MSGQNFAYDQGPRRGAATLPSRLPAPPSDPGNESPAEAGTSNGADLNLTGKAGSKTGNEYHGNISAATRQPLKDVWLTPLQELRAEFYEQADASSEWVDYVHAYDLNLIAIAAQAGVLAVCRTVFLPQHRFDFSAEGEPSAVIEAFDEDGETVLDLVAWPLHDPARFASGLGRAEGLGLWQVHNPATYFGGRPLQIWRTPLSWLQAGCTGAVILKPTSAPSWLSATPGPLAGENATHARELARLLHPVVDPSCILAPLVEVA
jgi:hypothetical protein